ncbi:MAG: oxidoreductase [Parasporobacterium sp.]|nr:oxidoreductase [Parasporobacterium sp.]
MERAFKILPVYTADVSGVCSALFELGGMVVMHDPSGCNSTYNTHDETRWYDTDSMIFISGLTENDAIMGNDDRLIKNVIDAAERLCPRFICLCGSPIPYINGTDFKAIAGIIESRTGIPSFHVDTNGTHDYVQGAGAALARIAERFVKAPDALGGASCRKDRRTLNIIGATPLDFGFENTIESLRKRTEQFGWEINSIWAMNDSLDNIIDSASADVNLVISSLGLQAAEVLEARFKMPYVAGAPIGGFAEKVYDALAQAAADRKSRIICNQPMAEGPAEVAVIREPVVGGSIARSIELKYGTRVKLINPIEKTESIMAEGDVYARGENETENALKGIRTVVADPLYRFVCPKEIQFRELPQEAFSGRSFWREMPDLFS